MIPLRMLKSPSGRLCLAAVVAAAASLPAAAFSAPGDQADLRVTKSDSPDPVVVGGLLTYTVEVANLGPNAATGVVLSDTLPASVDFVSASATEGTCSQQGRRVVCEIGNLASAGGQSRESATINVRPRRDGTISNTARARGAETDPGRQNSSDTETTVVNPRPGPAAASCRGVPATIRGTAGSDQLTGTGGPDVIAAFGGNDLIAAIGGRDLICAGRGNDTVGAGAAADRAIGGPGGDRLLGRGGPDLLVGNGGNDALRGNRGNDRLRGGRGSDLCRGGPGLDSQRSCER